MNPQNMSYDLQQQATLLFDQRAIPLSESEWQGLAGILEKSTYQHVIGGDANESHSVWVSRYFNDVDTPEALSPLSKDVEDIIMSAKMRAFYQQFITADNLCLRRCQANRLRVGDYIGEHKDQDSSPDYIATVVFHFSHEYEGGYFVTSEQMTDGREAMRYKPVAKTALVNNCSIAHQVTKVESGERLTLACFLSSSFERNQSSPAAFKVDDLVSPG